MASLLRDPLGRDRIPFLVCESGDRWCNTARRFAGPFQHGIDLMDQSPLIVTPVRHQKIRTLISAMPSAAILWELSSENATEISLTIAQVGVGRPDVLQLVALQNGSGATGRSLGRCTMEFGVRAVVSTPEEFSRIARLVHRQFNAAKTG